MPSSMLKPFDLCTCQNLRMQNSGLFWLDGNDAYVHLQSSIHVKGSGLGPIELFKAEMCKHAMAHPALCDDFRSLPITNPLDILSRIQQHMTVHLRPKILDTKRQIHYPDTETIHLRSTPGRLLVVTNNVGQKDCRVHLHATKTTNENEIL